MKLYQYDDIKKLNQALGSFAKNAIPVEKVKLLTVENKVQYFVLADPKEVSQPKPTEKAKVESKTEDKAKKTIKIESKAEVKPKEGQTEKKVGEKGEK